MKLFPSTLVVHGTADDITKLIKTIGHEQIINNPDIYQVSEYTIDNIRKIGKFLSQKSFSHDSKVILIESADKLNIESQNALLKNLEEPGENNYFILTTSRPNSLLPTIISRCHTQTYLNNIVNPDTLISIPSDTKEKLELSEKLLRDKNTTIDMLERQLSLAHAQLLKTPNQKNQRLIRAIIKTIALIKANVDPKTSLDYLMLTQ